MQPDCVWTVLLCQEGLDYQHTEQALRALARLHAISYCYRRDLTTPGQDAGSRANTALIMQISGNVVI